ncbi:hypothetical protein BC830DRAFT_1092281 [Chytriomyces sp. MP71]|nr:hypothetical protein BC830DRAFT_1092281 [Chytriomyces sp. MP71]
MQVLSTPQCLQRELPFVPEGLWSLVIDGVSLPPLHYATVKILDMYFSNKEVRSLLATADRELTKAKTKSKPKNLENSAGSMDMDAELESQPNSTALGFVPASLIASFKTAKKEGVTDKLILTVAKHCLRGAFEISNDGTCLRRIVAFDQRNVVDMIKSTVVLSQSCLLIRGIPHDAVQLDFLSFVADKAESAITRHLFDSDSGRSDEFKSCYIQFADPTVMVKLLALASALTYEDVTLSIESSCFPTTPTTTTPAGMASAPTTTIKEKGQIAIHPSEALGYPVNRLLKFGPLPDTSASTGFTASSLTAAARTAFERVAPVADCVVRPGDLFGYVRFRKAVAREVAGMLVKQGGGIDLGTDGEIVRVVALEGEEERLYHDVAKEKQKQLFASDAMIAITASRAVKTRRNQALKHQASISAAAASKRRAQQQQAKKSAAKASVAKAVLKGSKRLMEEDEDTVMGETAGGARMSRRIADMKRKKVKVDALEDLVQGLSAFQ